MMSSAEVSVVVSDRPMDVLSDCQIHAAQQPPARKDWQQLTTPCTRRAEETPQTTRKQPVPCQAISYPLTCSYRLEPSWRARHDMTQATGGRTADPTKEDGLCRAGRRRLSVTFYCTVLYHPFHLMRACLAGARQGLAGLGWAFFLAGLGGGGGRWSDQRADRRIHLAPPAAIFALMRDALAHALARNSGSMSLNGVLTGAKPPISLWLASSVRM